jgi:hypothetical protein
MADRSPILLIASGMQEIGKSYNSLKQMIYQAYVAPNKRSGLLFDTNNEYGAYVIDGKTHNIKVLPHDQIVQFGNSKNFEVQRIIPFHPNGMPMSPEETEKLLIKVINFYRGGTLMIEDLNTIFGDSLPVSVSGLLCNVRHRNCDVVFHLQSCARILPKMRQNAKVIRYHYQLDSIADSREKLAGEIEVFYLAEKLVNKQFEAGNKYFFVYIYRVIKKIKGQFSPRMFSEAIQDYISENPKILTPLLVKRDASGSKVNSYESALNQKTMELFKKYYGN